MYYLKKNKEYAITGMTIKANIVDSDIVKLTDKKTWKFKQKNTLKELVERKKEPDLDLKIVNLGTTKTVTIPFQKKSKNKLSKEPH